MKQLNELHTETLSQTLHNLMDDAREYIGMNEPTAEFLTLPSIPMSLDLTDLSFKGLMSMKPSSRKKFIRDKATAKWLEIKTKLQLEFSNMPDKLANTSLKLVFNMIDEIIDVLCAPIDDVYVYFLNTYNGIIRLYNEVTTKIDESKDKCSDGVQKVRDRKNKNKSKSKEERKEKNKEKLKELMMQLMRSNPYSAEVLAIIFMVQSMKSTIETLKSLREADAESVNESIEKINTTREIFENECFLTSQVIQTIVYLLGVLAPLMALLGAIFAGAKTADEAISAAQDNLLSEECKSIEENHSNKLEKLGSEIALLANENKNNFSYGKPSTEDSEEEATDASVADEPFCIDYSKLCEPTEDEEPISNRDTYIIDKAFIEIDKKSDYVITVEKGNEINMMSSIGTINGMSIEPQLDGTIQNVEGNVVLVKYKDLDVNELLERVNNIILSADQSEKTDAEIIVDQFNELGQIETVLMNYVPFLKYPSIPINQATSSNVKTYSVKSIVDKINSEYEDKLEEHSDKIQEYAGKDFVKAMTEQDNLLAIKDAVIGEKRRFYEEMFDMYDNYLTRNSYKVKYNNDDYSLFEHYMDLYDKMTYDKDNKWVCELFDIMNSVLSTREVAESENISKLIKDFNSFCNKNLKAFWTSPNSYFDEFDRLFGTDYSPISTSNENSSSMGAYKKMYDYLMALTGYKEPSQVTNTFDPTTIDPTTLDMSGTTTFEADESNIKEIEKNVENTNLIKKICTKFSLIHNIYKYDKSQRKNRSEDLTDETQKQINDRLKRLCSSELRTFDDYYTRLKNRYLELYNLYDGTCFESLLKPTIIKMSRVLYNNEWYDHYYVTCNVSSDEDIILSDEEQKEAELGASIITEAPNTTFKYWLRYCTYATLVHCMMVPFWSCGFMGPSGPISMPVIYIPIYFLQGRVSTLFGIGICGIYIYPMIVVINCSVDVASILMPINAVLDLTKAIIMKLREGTEDGLKKAIDENIDALTKKLSDTSKEEKIENQIKDLEEQSKGYGKVKADMKRYREQEKQIKAINKNSKVTILI